MTRTLPTTALIGFGEAASSFARAGGWGDRAIGWDILPRRRAAMSEDGVKAARAAPEAIVGADIVLGLVTADAALSAARDYGPSIDPGQIWCDMNSVSPDTKRLAAQAIRESGGRYVDVAIMAPVLPGRLAVPLLISGPAAEEADRLLRELGFGNTRVVGSEIGRASAIKMIRSVMVKGIEALTGEMMAAAEAAGVAEEVLASLEASERAMPWPERAAYNRERMAVHGARRAAEMAESAATLRALGVEPVMTEGTVRRQREAARPSPPSKDAA
jgi:3-hydroxyisobutyrate dehydrogenase-like beta-hydroxyacid dehydrogenase